ncbi:hypothetical protein HYPDE_40288 [Hyphomicrobium denitrificans 1NES1]|uniref:Uncharacterized protein n=1 Tax=Hyphomicrobium denitrificans 1NES1 TaxID=670307 RepID=N0BH07_9HYPH|nr:hypothetical protein [Hyphomicrobium denitrificans]AGK59726.1 hypothetical protein HYPDE_40288 [Hyphomicrobium denitrificans 1NES1]
MQPPIHKASPFIPLTRGRSAYLTRRYSERKEAAEQLAAGVKLTAI